MPTTTSTATIHELRRLFASYGLPEQPVSDNGPQFESDEFQVFLKSNRVKHIRGAPYHPSSNGLAERFVRTFQRALRAAEYTRLTFHQQLMNFLLSYRTTPHTITGATPASLFLNRHVRSHLDLLHPSVPNRVTTNQAKRKEQHDQHTHSRNFTVGQRVLVRNFRDGPKWVPGTLIARHGSLSFLVQVGEGIQRRRHMDHMLVTVDSPHDLSSPEAVPSSVSVPSSVPSSQESKIPSTLEPTLQSQNFHPLQSPLFRSLNQKLSTQNHQQLWSEHPLREGTHRGVGTPPERYTDLWERRN